MAKLIDADKLKADFIGNRYGAQAIEYVIDQQPTVDAVEVVRCENCRWFGEEDEDGHCWCFFNNVPTLRQGFCYFGERRNNDI